MCDRGFVTLDTKDKVECPDCGGTCEVSLEVAAKQAARLEEAAAPNLKRRLDAALAALERLKALTDSPDIDASGDWQVGLHCGVEDRGLSGLYQGADFGHAVGVEKTLEWARNEATAGWEAAK